MGHKACCRKVQCCNMQVGVHVQAVIQVMPGPVPEYKVNEGAANAMLRSGRQQPTHNVSWDKSKDTRIHKCMSQGIYNTKYGERSGEVQQWKG